MKTKSKKIECDFLFLIEHEDREGDSVRKIVGELSEIGLSSVVLSLEFHVHKFHMYFPKAVVLPYAFSVNQWPLNFLMHAFPVGVKWVGMNWEQLLTPINQSYKKPRDNFIKNNIFHLAWSDMFKQFLLKHGVAEKKIEVIGNVANEILEEKLKDKLAIKGLLAEEEGINQNKGWLFLPMNYAWAFIGEREIKGKIAKGYDDVIAWVYKKYASDCLQKFLYFVVDIAELYHDKEIIIRPHPSISVEQYLESFDRSGVVLPENVSFSKKFSIREWIVSADIVGSSWSSSVWDAANIGKPAFLFTPLEKPSWHKVWWETSVPNIVSAKELKKSFERNTCHTASSLGHAKSVAYWMSGILKVTDANQSPEEPKLSDLDIFARIVRSCFREFSMKLLKGFFITRGLRRDYFEPELSIVSKKRG